MVGCGEKGNARYDGKGQAKAIEGALRRSGGGQGETGRKKPTGKGGLLLMNG